MTRFMLLDTGEELDPERAQALVRPAPVRLRLLEAAPPFGKGEIVQVSPPDSGRARPGDLLICRRDPVFFIRPRGDGSAPGEILGRVVAIERGSMSFPLERGLLARLPARWLPRAVEFLEVLARLRHPFTPPLFLGRAEACLAGVREKYDRQAEVRRQVDFAAMGLEELEREIVERRVKPGGRVLDIGCGAGREALGFARMGYRVVGIDIAPRMLEAARLNAVREGLEVTFRLQSATELDEPPGSTDAIYFAGCYAHIPGRALRVQTLTRMRRALVPDGVLIFDVAYCGSRGWLSRSRLVDLLRTVGLRLSRAWRLSEPGDGLLREPSEASDPREACFFHHFAGPEEARAEIEAAGLNGEEVLRGWWVCRRLLP